MSQVPLAPPPPTGGPLDSWLYLLWRRLTQAGQILWETITPGTSADVAAVVTDETGSPGSLVFSGNPTLTGLTVSGADFTSRGITDSATATVFTIPVSGAPSVTRSFVVGNATGLKTLTVSGADSGTSAGSAVYFQQGGVTNFALGNYSAIIGGTYSQLGCVFSGNDIAFLAGGTVEQVRVTATSGATRYMTLTGSVSGNPTISTSAGDIDIAKSVAITGTVSTSGYTVATLPAGTVGDRAYVTDALAPAYGVAVAGGGAVTIPVFHNGAAWICA